MDIKSCFLKPGISPFSPSTQEAEAGGSLEFEASLKLQS